jgi:uncharacterized membrane protein YGL010W
MSDTSMTYQNVGPRLVPYLKDYASFHRTPGNQLTHAIGLPAITITTLGMLSQVVLWANSDASVARLDLGVILWAVGTLWYLFLDWKIGLPFSLCGFGFYMMGRSLPLSVNFAIWVAGWILQFVGHYKYEKKSPAFLKNVTHLLVGPLWLFVKLVGYAR